MSELMTTKEASEYLQIGYMTLYKLVQQGEIPASKVGGHWRFNKTILDNWFATKSKVINRNILILGDDVDTATLSNTLRSVDHHKVITVNNLEQALTELTKRTYSLIFISSTTTNPNCTKTISEIRDRNYKSTIVAGIGPDDEPISLDAMASGPTFVIKKPFEETDILKMLNNANSQGTAKTNDQLITALVELRQHIDDFSIADTERKVIEDSLRMSEDKLRSFMESSNDAFILTDAKLNIVEMNTSAAKYLPAGLDGTNVVGKNILDISPSLKDFLYERYLELLKTNKPIEIDDIVIDPQRGTHMRAKVFRVGNGFGAIATDITDSKLLEALKDSEVFSSTLLDNAPNPIMVYEADTTIKYVNQAFEDLTGFSLQEVEGIKIPYPWWEEDTINKILETYKEPILPKPQKLEIRFKKKNGEPFWVEVNAKTININDETFYYIVNWVNITERKALEISLRESEEKYRALVEQSLQGIMIIQDRRILFANNIMARGAGYSVAQLLSFSPEEVAASIHPDDRQFVLESMHNRLEGKKVATRYEFRLVDGKGAIRWVDIDSNIIEYAGKPALQLTVADITDRKEMKQALTKEEYFLETIINSLPCVFYLVDESRHFIKWNKNLEIKSGYSAEEIANMDPLMLFQEKDRKLVEDKFKKIYKAGRSSLEFQALSKSGKTVPYYLTGDVVLLGTERYIAGIGFDVSELKQTDDLLRKNQDSQTIIDKLIFTFRSGQGSAPIATKKHETGDRSATLQSSGEAVAVKSDTRTA